MNLFTQRLPGLFVGLFRIMFGMLWLQAALQKAPWVINAQGQRFGWLSNWLWTETQHPTFGFYKAMLEHVVLPHFTFFGYLEQAGPGRDRDDCEAGHDPGVASQACCEEVRWLPAASGTRTPQN